MKTPFQAVTEILLLCAIFTVLSLALIVMGCTITAPELKAVIQRPVPLLVILANHFVFCPAIILAVILMTDLDPYFSMGLIVNGLSPPTTQASIASYTVGGDGALSLTASIVSMALSIICMPALFALMLSILNVVWSASGSPQTLQIKLPYVQIGCLLLYLCAVGGIGIAIRHRSEARAKAVEQFFKKLMGPILLCMIVIFFLNWHLISVAFYGGEFWLSYWGAAILSPALQMLWGDLTGAPFGAVRRDAMALTTCMRNPALALGIAGLSFNTGEAGLTEEQAAKAFGMVVIGPMLWHFSITPSMLIRRKLRYGRYCCCCEPKDVEEDEEEGELDVEGKGVEGEAGEEEGQGVKIEVEMGALQTGAV